MNGTKHRWWPELFLSLPSSSEVVRFLSPFRMEADLSFAVSLHFSPLVADSTYVLPKHKGEGKLFISKVNSKAKIGLRLNFILQ